MKNLLSTFLFFSGVGFMLIGMYFAFKSGPDVNGFGLGGFIIMCVCFGVGYSIIEDKKK